jgi:acyl-coenzyme A synthetase/AMP-(fatty) acid ligase
VITAASATVTPVRLEQRIESIDGIELAAVVGVGPAGTQQIVAVIQRGHPARSAQLADPATHDAVRASVEEPIAAVFEVPTLPVDRRHNSKVDRARLAAWAAQALAGRRVSNP